jgi:hypothetical protein
MNCRALLMGRHNSHPVPWKTGPSDETVNGLSSHSHKGHAWPIRLPPGTFHIGDHLSTLLDGSVLGSWPIALSCIRNRTRFANWTCFRLQVKCWGGTWSAGCNRRIYLNHNNSETQQYQTVLRPRITCMFNKYSTPTIFLCTLHFFWALYASRKSICFNRSWFNPKNGHVPTIQKNLSHKERSDFIKPLHHLFINLIWYSCTS